MNKKIISDMIPLAMKACETWLVENGTQRNAIYGKVASLGVDIRQMDILPAVLGYEDSRPEPRMNANSEGNQQNSKENQQKDGWRVNNAVFDVVAGYVGQNNQLLEKYESVKKNANGSDSIWSTKGGQNASRAMLKEAILALYTPSKSDLIPMTKMLVEHACVALKITLNTFEGGKSS